MMYVLEPPPTLTGSNKWHLQCDQTLPCVIYTLLKLFAVKMVTKHYGLSVGIGLQHSIKTWHQGQLVFKCRKCAIVTWPGFR